MNELSDLLETDRISCISHGVMTGIYLLWILVNFDVFLSKVFYLLSKGIEVAYGFELYTPFAVVVVYIWEQKWVNLVLDV